MESTLITLFLAAALESAGADNYDEIKEVSTPALLPKEVLRSSDYEIEDPARAGDYFYHFVVTSDFGTFEISSLAMLRIRLHEISVLSEIAPTLVETREDYELVGRSDEDVFSDPIGTAWRIRRKAGNSTAKSQAGVMPGGPQSSRGPQEPGPDRHWRTAAARVGLDAYSSNPKVRRTLGVLAARLSDMNFPASLGSSPSRSGFLKSGGAIEPALELQIASEIKNSTLTELDDRQDEILKTFDVVPPLRSNFLRHAAYSPSLRYKFLRYLERLDSLSGKSAIVAAAIAAETEVDALAFLNYVRILVAHDKRIEPVVRVLGVTKYPLVQTAGGIGLLALPIDFLPWTPRIETIVQELRALRDSLAMKEFNVLLAGRATVAAREQIEALDAVLRDDFLR